MSYIFVSCDVLGDSIISSSIGLGFMNILIASQVSMNSFNKIKKYHSNKNQDMEKMLWQIHSEVRFPLEKKFNSETAVCLFVCLFSIYFE